MFRASGADFQGIDTSARLSLSMVASRRARFRFARPDHCSSTTSTRLNFQVAPDPTRNARMRLYGSLVGSPKLCLLCEVVVVLAFIKPRANQRHAFGF